ncbi:unnamed protein product, partial [marine sediment metagenome]
PFMLRSVTRIGHARSDIVLGEISRERRKGSFEKDRTWLVYTPREARINKPLMLERFEKIKKRVNTLVYNQLKLADGAKLGIVACGLSYSYALEAVKWLGIEDKVSILKIGTPHPLPEELGASEAMAHAILCHNPTHGIPRETKLDKALFCADPLTGLIIAAALVRPDKKLAGVEVRSVRKKFKEKSFAAGANREQISQCTEIGLELDEFLELGLEAMKGIADDLGL